MGIFEELQERGLIAQVTDDKEIKDDENQSEHDYRHKRRTAGGLLKHCYETHINTPSFFI